MASAGKLIVLMHDRGLQNPLYTTTATLPPSTSDHIPAELLFCCLKDCISLN